MTLAQLKLLLKSLNIKKIRVYQNISSINLMIDKLNQGIQSLERYVKPIEEKYSNSHVLSSPIFKNNQFFIETIMTNIRGAKKEIEQHQQKVNRLREMHAVLSTQIEGLSNLVENVEKRQQYSKDNDAELEQTETMLASTIIKNRDILC